MENLPVEAVVDAVDGVHGLRVHGDELALVLLDRRLLLVCVGERERDSDTYGTKLHAVMVSYVRTNYIWRRRGTTW